MGYHSKCSEDIPYLQSKDMHHNYKRDRLTENALKRYTETNPEYRKVLEKYYRPDKKLPRITDTSGDNIVRSKNYKSIETPVCSDMKCSSMYNSTERLCPNCRKRFYIAKKKPATTKTTTFKEPTNDETYWNNRIDDDHPPFFPPRYPIESTSLILPAMFTDDERYYYQSKHPKYPPVEKITYIYENIGRSIPNGNYNIITGEELCEYK